MEYAAVGSSDRGHEKSRHKKTGGFENVDVKKNADNQLDGTQHTTNEEAMEMIKNSLDAHNKAKDIDRPHA